MSTKTNLHIADPCNENWQDMTSTEQGKFCQSCRKEVIDFSLLSDKQILEYFSKYKGNTCGRFRDDQLNRPLENQHAKAKVSLWKWFMTVGLGVWFSNKAVAQTGTVQMKCDSKTQPADAQQEVIVFGDAVAIDAEETYQPTHRNLRIKGTVVNNENEPLAGASISLNGKAYKVSANDGTFNIHAKVPISKDSVELTFSSVGYETKTVKILSTDKKGMVVEMVPKADELKEFVVTGAFYTTRKAVCRVGEVSVIRTNVLKQAEDSIKRITAKTLDKTLFKTYPNPVQKGSFVNINVEAEGTYLVQLVSNASQLISSQKVAMIKGQTYQLQISDALAGGIYYITMVNAITGKRVTDKIVVL